MTTPAPKRAATCGCQRCDLTGLGPCPCAQCQEVGCWCSPDGHDEQSDMRWLARKDHRPRLRLKNGRYTYG